LAASVGGLGVSLPPRIAIPWTNSPAPAGADQTRSLTGPPNARDRMRAPTETAYASVELYDPRCAADHDAVNLALVSMQQDRVAAAADIIHRMIASL
jgi:hypothetical protein